MNVPSTGRRPCACNCSIRSCAAFNVAFSCLLAALSLASRHTEGTLDCVQSCNGVAEPAGPTMPAAAINSIDTILTELLLSFAYRARSCSQYLLAPAPHAQHRGIGPRTPHDLQTDGQAAFRISAGHR